jgi:hypothetical protein
MTKRNKRRGFFSCLAYAQAKRAGRLSSLAEKDARPAGLKLTVLQDRCLLRVFIFRKTPKPWTTLLHIDIIISDQNFVQGDREVITYWYEVYMPCPKCGKAMQLQSAHYSADGEMRFFFACAADATPVVLINSSAQLSHSALVRDVDFELEQRAARSQQPQPQPEQQQPPNPEQSVNSPLPQEVVDDRKFLEGLGIRSVEGEES